MVSPVNNRDIFILESQIPQEVLAVPLAPSGSSDDSAYRFIVGNRFPLVIGASPVGFVNQGNITLEECRAQALYLCQLLDNEQDIDVVYSPVQGLFATVHQSTVRLLRAGWDDWFSSCPGQHRLQFCCGASTSSVAAALRDYTHSNFITVVAIAPSTSIPQELCYRATYYRAYGDVTSMLRAASGLDMVVLSRHPESMGTFDNCFASSTFMTAIQWEYRLFRSTGPIGRLQMTIRVPGTSVQVLVASLDEALRLGLISTSSFNNLYEGAMNLPYPRDWLDWSTSLIGTLRRILLTMDAMFLMGLFPDSLRIQLYLGVCLLIGTNTLRSIFLGYIPRRQNVRSRLRTLGLRTVSLEYIQSLYELPFLMMYTIDSRVPVTIRGALGVLVAFLGPAAVIDYGARFYLPLREQIQHLIVRSEQESVIEEREGTNLPAGRVGFSLGVQGTVIWGVVGGIIGAVTASMFNTALYEPFDPASSNHTERTINNTLTTHSNSTECGFNVLRTSYSTVLVVYGALSIASIVLNGLSLHRMLRNRPQREEPEVRFEDNIEEEGNSSS